MFKTATNNASNSQEDEKGYDQRSYPQLISMEYSAEVPMPLHMQDFRLQ